MYIPIVLYSIELYYTSYSNIKIMQNRVILITGAASGIGLATARLLASKGARLSLSDTNSEGLEAIGKEIETQWKGDDEGVMTRRVDVRLEEEVSSSSLKNQHWISNTKG
jgi:NADP-dependent 3-hydroxy acid dehydrogenase YdfG